MATPSAFEPIMPSGDTVGLGAGIRVFGITQGAPTAIHTAGAGAIDSIWLYVTNNDVADRILTLVFDDGTDITEIKQLIPFTSGLSLVLPALTIKAGLVLSAYSDVADKLVVHSSIQRATLA